MIIEAELWRRDNLYTMEGRNDQPGKEIESNNSHYSWFSIHNRNDTAE